MSDASDLAARRSAPDLFFTSLVASYVDDPRFVRREWLIERVEAARARPDARFVLLTGEPGSGKSGLMADLARRHAEAVRYFIRRDSVTPLAGGDARTFLFAVGHQLAALRPALFEPGRLEIVVRQRAERIAGRGRVVGIEVGDLVASPFHDTALEVTQHGGVVEGRLVGVSAARLTLEARLLELSNLQYLALFDPAEALAAEDPEARIVVLLDALDEIRYGPRGEDVLTWLATCPPLPANIRFVLTARSDSDLLADFRRARAAEIVELAIAPDAAADREHVTQDLRRYISGVAAEPAVAAALDAHDVRAGRFVDGAVARAEGNFQYLVALARGIDAALAHDPPSVDLPALLALEGIPAGTMELYRFFLGRVKARADAVRVPVSRGPLDEPEDRPAWAVLHNPVLAALAVAFEPLTPDQLLAYAGVPRATLPRALEDLGQFLDVLEDGSRRLYHATLPEFLTGPATAAADDPFHADRGTWHARIAGRLIRANPDWLACNDRYALAHTPAHLIEAIRWSIDAEDRSELTTRLDGLLTDPSFLAASDVDRLLPQLRQAASDWARAWAAVYQVASADLRSQPISERASYLELAARKRGETEIGDAIDRELPVRPWKVPAARWRRPAVHIELRGHRGGLAPLSGGVWALAAGAPSGRAIAASGGYDGTVRFWDLEHVGAMHPPLQAHGGNVSAVAIGAGTGRTLAISTGTVDPKARLSNVRLWDVEAGTLLAELVSDEEARVSTVAFASLAGRPAAVVASEYGTVRAWDLDDAVRAREATARDLPPRAVWDAHEVLGVDAGPVVWLGSLDHPCLGSAAGRIVAATRDADRTVGLWDLDGGRLLQRLDPGTAVREIAVGVASHGCPVVIVGDDEGSLHVWRPGDDRAIAVVPAHAGPITALAVGESSGRPIAVSAGTDRTVRVWVVDPDRRGDDKAYFSQASVLRGHEGLVRAVAIATAGGHPVALSGGADGSVHVWDLADAIEKPVDARGPDDSFETFALGTVGGQPIAVSGSEDGTVRPWNPARLVPLADGRVGHDGAVNCTAVGIVAGAPIALSGGEDGLVRVWALAPFSALGPELTGHDGFVDAVAIGPRRPIGLSGGNDGHVRVWDLERVRPVPVRFEQGSSVDSLATGEIGEVDVAISGGHDGDVRVWDLDHLVPRGKSLRGHQRRVTAVATGMMDGIPVAISGDYGGTLRGWDLERSAGIQTVFSRRGGAVWGLAVGTVGGTSAFVSGGDDGVLRVWDLANDEPLREIAIGCLITFVGFVRPGVVLVGCRSGLLRIELDPASVVARCRRDEAPGVIRAPR